MKTVKENVGGKTKSVTHQASATFVVERMKPWAVGTFNGGNTNGIATLTVSNVGKLSGKWMSEDLTWTLSAASFDAYISSEPTVLIPTDEDGLYRVYLYFPPKSGKFDGFSACESVMFAP